MPTSWSTGQYFLACNKFRIRPDGWGCQNCKSYYSLALKLKPFMLCRLTWFKVGQVDQPSLYSRGNGIDFGLKFPLHVGQGWILMENRNVGRKWKWTELKTAEESEIPGPEFGLVSYVAWYITVKFKLMAGTIWGKWVKLIPFTKYAESTLCFIFNKPLLLLVRCSVTEI